MSRIIFNNIIPFKGFTAMNLFGLVFVRKDCMEYFDGRVSNHEDIHTAQMKELLFVFFYLIYILEWLFNVFRYRFNFLKEYRNISFEKEAYNNEINFKYLQGRRHYSQWK